MPLSSRRSLLLQVNTLASRTGLMRAEARHRWLGGPPPRRLLLASDGLAFTSEQQFAPLLRHADALRRRLGVVVESVPVERALRLAPERLAAADVLGLKLSFLTPPAEAERIARHFRAALAGSSTRLVYFDGDDDLCIQWPDVLAQVDGYVKKHVFADFAGYGRAYAGKSNLTDYVVQHHGRSFADNVIARTDPVPAAELPKLHLGWNIGLDDKIADLAKTLPPVDAATKDIDVMCRAFVPPEVWIHPLRAPLVERIEAMSDRYRVLAPSSRVSQEQYYQEMRRARICVSPFGYGELCWRDFEAVLCGCLLVKPDMGHVRTAPDIFVAGQTYAPVRWDYADLEAVCARYLADEPERLRVASRARQVLLDALQPEALVRSVEGLLASLSHAAFQTSA